jgi:ubiquinone/menaquinone biosynthesis C-methylase UbiE
MEQIQRIQQTFDQFYQSGDYQGLFNHMYLQAQQGSVKLPWTQMKPNPIFFDWVQKTNLSGDGKSALVIGSGLGDDAEELEHLGFSVEAFDFSATALDWCRERFPHSQVQYSQLDLFELPETWQQRFHFVMESLTLPSLPYAKRTQAIESIARTVAPAGTLFVLCFGSDVPANPAGKIPLPLTHAELDQFQCYGLQESSFETFTQSTTGQKLYRVVYQRPQ